MKIRTLLKAPILTQSGYGEHSREIFRALISDSLFDVHVEPLNWGHCSYITGNTEDKALINKCIEKFVAAKHQNQENWDLFVHCSIPNEFEVKGKFNVGVTAGIETDRVSHVWVQSCNKMDLIIVPSEHSKKTILDTVVDWQNPNTGETGAFKLNKPIEVVHEGFSKVFKKYTETSEVAQKFYDKLSIESDFNFLHISQWGKGGYGEDRKNIALLVKYFIETFAGRKDVGLVLKINMARNSVSDYNGVEQRLQQIRANYKPEEVPPIYLLHANLSDEEMAALYNHPKIKAFISLTHGEGFGRPLLEAAACGLPVMATNWSGQLDFLNLGKFVAFNYDLKEIPEVAVWENILIKDSKWANIREDDVKNRMRKIVSAYSMPQQWAKELSEKVHEKFNLDKVCEDFRNTLKRHLIKNEAAVKVNPKEHLESFLDTPDDYNVLYTMPMSTGDVFISTAVIDGLMKELPEDAKIYFATKPEYAGVLEGNPNIYKVIPWNETMLNMDLTESVFDLVLTPNVATQYTFSNWVRRGQGRLLAEEFANHCNAKLGNYFIRKDPIELPWAPLEGGVSPAYMTFHPGSGKGQWEARRYDDWQEVLINLKNLYPDLKIVQVGSTDEPSFKGVDVDLRGKTTHQQLATVLEHAHLHLSIDTFSMHLAAAVGTPLVAIFGCSYASATGLWVKDKEKAKYILLQSERMSGCKNKACYKNKCAVNPEGNGPINEIDPKDIFKSCVRLLSEY